MTIDDLLANARARIAPRVMPTRLAEAAVGALVVDVRPVQQRWRDGDLPGAVPVDRNVLEWRLDPSSEHRLPGIRRGQRVIVVCNEGYQSSLAAATLIDLGLDATDLAGGFKAWHAACHSTP